MPQPLCRQCGKPAARVIFGLVEVDPELSRQLEEGSVVLGGCCQPMPSPKWYCEGCQYAWPHGESWRPCGEDEEDDFPEGEA
jgi:hypothetical protein